MKTGTVKWYNSRKGYGFIKPVDGGFDVYVHISAVKRAGLGELREGQKINFDIATDARSGEIFADNLSVPRESHSASLIAEAVHPLQSPLPFLGMLISKNPSTGGGQRGRI